MRIFVIALAFCLASCQKESEQLKSLSKEETSESDKTLKNHRMDKRNLGMGNAGFGNSYGMNQGFGSYGTGNTVEAMVPAVAAVVPAQEAIVPVHGTGVGQQTGFLQQTGFVQQSRSFSPVSQAAAIVQQPIIEPAIQEPPIIQRIIQPILQRIEQQKILQPIVQPMELPTIVKAAVVEPVAVERGAMSEAAMIQGAINPGQYQQNIVEPVINKAPIYQPVLQPVIQPVEQEKILQPIVETVQKAPIIKQPIVEPMVAAHGVQVGTVQAPMPAPSIAPLPTAGMSKGLTAPVALGMASPQMAMAVQGVPHTGQGAANAQYRRRYRKEEALDDVFDDGITLF
jgi:hypothetical protein